MNVRNRYVTFNSGGVHVDLNRFLSTPEGRALVDSTCLKPTGNSMSIVSNALRKSAGHHDAHCQFNIAGVCTGLGCVLCHIRLIGECGGGQKPDDTLAAFGCGACHDVFDGRVPGLEKNSTDWNFYALRALARQLRWWQQWGFITIKGVK